MRRAVGSDQSPLVLGLVALAFTFVGCVGVGDARYVYQDGQFGVVGIPSNSPAWPHHYRAQAEELMKAHFPDGYAIVRAEEVVEGSRTLVLDGKTTAEVAPGVAVNMVKIATLGRTHGRTQSDNLKIKECRILYRKAAATDTAEGFAAEPGLDPARYHTPTAEGAKEETSKTAAEHHEPAKATH